MNERISASCGLSRSRTGKFLSIAAMVWLAVYLRQRGSPESKPVHAPHHQAD